MKKFILPALAAMMVGAIAIPHSAYAEEEAAAQETTTEKDSSKWQTTLKEKNHLTDEQIKSMQEKGLSYSQMAMASTLAEKSGKSLDEVLKMRTESKMGWGKIAKELGVPPKELGQSVAADRHEMRDEKRAEREEKKEAKREARIAKKESKREEKSNRTKH